MRTQDAPRLMGAIMIARMAEGIATAAISLLQRHKDCSVETSTIRIAPQHEPQAPLRSGQASQAMLGTWIVMGTEWAVNRWDS